MGEALNLFLVLSYQTRMAATVEKGWWAALGYW
ncbi:hypothetical protein SBA4_610002 [Candidatus Sulfopaludibacter sp. SbA4]|nr:hypothetical protein SBA4_610002 [Candidatus Sulfopaludibacter sp. SbA4]